MGLPHCMNGGPILVVTSMVRYRYWFALMSDFGLYLIWLATAIRNAAGFWQELAAVCVRWW